MRVSCAQGACRRAVSTSAPLFGSKETRQGKYATMLRRLGVSYDGTLSDAKSTLNRFLRHDAALLGVNEIGNGNNRNILDRLIPRLMKECTKLKLPDTGDYADLRNRLKTTNLLKKAIAFDDATRLATIHSVQISAGSTPAKEEKARPGAKDKAKKEPKAQKPKEQTS